MRFGEFYSEVGDFRIGLWCLWILMIQLYKVVDELHTRTWLNYMEQALIIDSLIPPHQMEKQANEHMEMLAKQGKR